MNLDRAPGMSGAEPIGGEIGLGQSERAAARPKPDRSVRKRGAERHASETGDRDEVGAAPSKTEVRDSSRLCELAGIQNLRKTVYSVQILHLLRF